MFRIAICDDNGAVCSAIENIIDDFFKTETMHYEIDGFQSGEELLKELDDHEKYDLIYLDIELARLNGVEVGRYIRENYWMIIHRLRLFLPSHPMRWNCFRYGLFISWLNLLHPDRLSVF